MKKKNKAKLRNIFPKGMSANLTVRISKNETIQIVPKVNSLNQIKCVDVVKLRYEKQVANIRVNRRSLRPFLEMIQHFSKYIDEESIDQNVPDITRSRIC